MWGVRVNFKTWLTVITIIDYWSGPARSDVSLKLIILQSLICSRTSSTHFTSMFSVNEENTRPQMKMMKLKNRNFAPNLRSPRGAFFGGQDSLQYKINPTGPLTRYVKLWFAHAPGMLGTFSRHRLQRKPLVSDPDVHHGTCVMHVPWCTSGSLSRGGRENVPGIPGTCATRNFTYLARGPCWKLRNQLLLALNFYSSAGKTDSLKLPSAVLGKGGNGYRWSSRIFYENLRRIPVW